MTDLDAALGGREAYRAPNSRGRSAYYRLLSQTLARIHDRIPMPEGSTLVPPAPDEREEFFDGACRKRLVIYLLSQGCDWALKKAHGCTMCGHLAKQTRRLAIPAGDHQRQFQSVFDTTDWSRYPILNLYNNGSFLNDAEVSAAERRAIVQAIGANPHIRMVVFETRPEFVREDRVRELRDLLPGKHVEIAIGLETIDDHRRAVCINKGFTLRQYDRAAAIVTKYLKLRTYVLLKPPFYAEAEAAEDAIATIRHAFSAGSATVSLEPCTIQAYTLSEHLSACGLYEAPWLWTIVEVVRCTAALGKLVVGMFQFYPAPTLVPHNCDACNETVLERLRRYNRSLDPAVFEGLACDCQAAWHVEMSRAAAPFENRVMEGIRRMNELLDRPETQTAENRGQTTISCG
ncbi:MAG: archaeosine biosynthesis radical SAM protein RaSEA [Burkholderiales bacterium]|nr:archaeosine biosynthesis radical SAM protein RaSEA [Burkholderiales bacterium]